MSISRPTVAMRRTPRRREGGMVTLIVMLFLVGTVIFMMAKALDTSTANTIDSLRQEDGHAAFFLAESGIDAAQAGIGPAAAGSFTSQSCANLGSTKTLGRGSYTVTGSALPANCGAGACQSCTLSSTGTVGSASRTVQRSFNLDPIPGVACDASQAGANCSNLASKGVVLSPPNWKLTLSNSTGVDALAIFAFGNPQQGNVTPECLAAFNGGSPLASNCSVAFSVQFGNNGGSSVNLMTNAVNIANGRSYDIFQTIAKQGGNPENANGAEVGALFEGTTSAPSFAGPTTGASASSASYAASGTTTGSGTTGTTTNGAASSAAWCYGGDALVFTYSSNTAGPSAAIAANGVTFNTAGTGAQNVKLQPVAKFPTSGTAGISASYNTTAEIWAARNPNLVGSSPLGTGASSWKGRGTAAVGAQWTTTSDTSTSISGTTLTVGAGFTSWPNQIISVGDTVVSTGVAANTTIVRQLTSNESSGTGLGGRGTYEVSVSQTVAAAINRQWTVNSNVLNVTACSVCFLAQSDAVALTGLSTGRTINAAQASPSTAYGRTEAAGGAGRYSISGAATRVASDGSLFVGTPATPPPYTLYIPATSSQPAVTSPAMLITVHDGATASSTPSGTGALPPGTQVVSVAAANAATTSFAVNKAPTTSLDNATICAGTCAFFDQSFTTDRRGNKTFSSTSYTLAFTGATTNGWSSGFTCLKGVTKEPSPVTSSTVKASRWTEVIN